MKNYILILVTLVVFNSCQSEFRNIVSESIATESSSLAETTKATALTDTIKENHWNSGKVGTHWINFNFDKPKEIKEIEVFGLTDPTSNMDIDILVKTSNATEFKNAFSKSERIEKEFRYKFSPEIQNTTDVKIVLKNDTSWGCIQTVSILGR